MRTSSLVVAVYMAELSSRFGVNADALRKRNADPRLFTTSDREEALKFAPGAQFVGTYAATVADKPLVEIDFRDGKLSAKLPASPLWVVLANSDVAARYRAEVPSQDISIEFEVVNGTVSGLVLDPGTGHPRMALVRMR
jgi:hypothetical protein